jgi:hypothetical protein
MTRGQSEALATTLRALAGVVTGGDVTRAAAALPWLAFLSPRDQAACLRELSDVASAAVATGRLRRLEETMYQWEATGLAAWDEQRLRARPDHGAYTRDEPLPLARPAS